MKARAGGETPFRRQMAPPGERESRQNESKKSRGTNLTNRVAAGLIPRRALRRLRPPESVPILPKPQVLEHLAFDMKARYRALLAVSHDERMSIPYFQIDTFTSSLFTGNPAGVCLLADWLPDSVLQSIAAENNLAETAFVVQRDSHFDLQAVKL